MSCHVFLGLLLCLISSAVTHRTALVFSTFISLQVSRRIIHVGYNVMSNVLSSPVCHYIQLVCHVIIQGTHRILLRRFMLRTSTIHLVFSPMLSRFLQHKWQLVKPLMCEVLSSYLLSLLLRFRFPFGMKKSNTGDDAFCARASKPVSPAHTCSYHNKTRIKQ